MRFTYRNHGIYDEKGRKVAHLGYAKGRGRSQRISPDEAVELINFIFDALNEKAQRDERADAIGIPRGF